MGLSLQTFDIAKAADSAATAEKMILKLQAGLMPPPGARVRTHRRSRLVNALETTVDRAAAARPTRDGGRFHDPQSCERAWIRELLALDVDAGKWLPLDTMSANFDNIADEQALSPTLLESYLNAAADISRMAVGDRSARGIDHTYTNASGVAASMGSHRGCAGTGGHGDRPRVPGGWGIRLRGDPQFCNVARRGHRYFGERRARRGAGAGRRRRAAPRMAAAPTPCRDRAGPGSCGAAAVVGRVRSTVGRAGEDLLRPHDWSLLAVARGWWHHDAAAFARSDHSWSVQDHGRFADAESSEVVYLPSHLARRRGAVRARDRHAGCGRSVSASHFAARDRPVDAVLPEGADGGFEGGAGAALEAILSSPHFIFRLEREPETATPGTAVRVADLDLASRLSFFIWGTPRTRN